MQPLERVCIRPTQRVIATMNCRKLLVAPVTRVLALTVALLAFSIGGVRFTRADPGPTATSGRPIPKPVLKVYACPAGAAATIAARLNEEFAGSPGVRIVPDQRTSQVLVLAPAATQIRIAERVNQVPQAGPAAPSERPSSPRGPAAPPLPDSNPPEASGERAVQLWHATAGKLETTLAGMLGPRLSAPAAAGSDTVAYRLALPDGGSVHLSVDRQANRISIRGPAAAVDSCVQLIHALDTPREAADRSTRLVSMEAARSADVQRTIAAIRNSAVSAPRPSADPSSPAPGPDAEVTMLYQAGETAPPTQPEAPAPGAGPAANALQGEPPPAALLAEDPRGENGALIGPVQIEWLEGLDVLIIRGHQRDVERVIEIIEQIERLSVETEPAIVLYHLRHVDCEALTALVSQLYGEVFSLRQGSVSITALVKPNAILLIGRQESVDTVIDLIKRLDRPVASETQFRVFRLQHASAETAAETVREFYEERGGLGTQVRVTADFRSNSLIIEASPRDLAEVADMIARLDTPTSEAVNEIRVFKLSNSLAEQLAPILQDALTGQAGTGRVGGQTATAGQQTTARGRTGAGRQGWEPKSSALQFLTVDTQGQQRLKSGILIDVQVTADVRANALLVSAPAESMPLIEALIRELDQLPAAEAQIKVFTIINGDAPSLMDMLEALFGQQATTDQLAVRTGAIEGESSLVRMRFAVDVRTNSIIASGSAGDLSVVEAILLRLDESDVRQRQSQVYRLKNAPAQDVANAINEYLRSERQVQQITPGLLSAFEQIEREVVVVPEPVSNSLIVSATPRFFDEIADLVEQLDERPPMVMIQVLIAEVALNDTDEFGVELGLQDSILFDRSENGTPGFLFNSTSALGNDSSASALANAAQLGGQALSNLGLARGNSALGFGGLVLSASSESVSILIRALKEDRRLDVLSRPQVMTMDNQPAFIQVGQRVPRITGTSTNQVGQTNSVALENVGLILLVTPRISPDGLVVMEINAEKSELGPESEGIPVSVSEGQVIRSPRIDTVTAQTTVSATTGQTVILGGLITKNTSEAHRRVPGLGDIPVLGDLFRYDVEVERKAELLIIMTPHVVESEADVERVKQIEAARMHWCLCDVMKMHDGTGLRTRSGEWSDAETRVVYPDLAPGGEMIPAPGDTYPLPEVIPAPSGLPRQQATPPYAPGEEGSPFLLEPVPPQRGEQGSIRRQPLSLVRGLPKPDPNPNPLRGK